MPGSKTSPSRSIASRKATSVTVVRSSKQQVVESFSSITGIKTVSQKRVSGGKTLTTWSSPSILLTSPQSWISGSEATFLSPKSPPKMRITRRSSVYVTKSGSQKLKPKPKLSPKGTAEFKFPVTSVAKSSRTAKSGRSSVSQTTSQVTVTAGTRRSSAHGQKASGTTVVKVESKSASPPVKKAPQKSKRVKSPKASPSKKGKSPKAVTRSRKRNVSELEEETLEKPVAKRSRQRVTSVVLSPSPQKAKKSPPKKVRKTTRKTALNQSQDTLDPEKVNTPSPALQSGGRPMKKAVRKPSATRLSKSQERKASTLAQADEENNDEDEVDLTSSSEKSTRKRKLKADSTKDTPKRKSAKSTPKSASSKKSKKKSASSSKKSSSSSKKSGSAKKSPRKTPAKTSRKTPAKTPKTLKSPPVKVLLFGSEQTAKETSVKEKNETRRKATTLKSSVNSKKTPTKPATPKSGMKKSASSVRSRRVRKSIDITSPTKETATAISDEENMTTTPKSQGRMRSKTHVARSVNKSAKKKSMKSTPKSNQKSEKKSLVRSSSKKSSSVSRSVKKSANKSVSGKLDGSDVLDGSYLETSVKQKNSSSKSKKPVSLISKVARSDEDERILEILRNAVNSTPKAGKISTPKSLSKSAKPVAATPKRLQSTVKHATPKFEKSVKIAATPRSTKGSQTSSNSSATRITTSYRKTPRIVVTKAVTPQSGRNSQVSRQKYTRESIGTPRSARLIQSLSGAEYEVGQTSFGLQSLGRRSQALSPSSLNSVQNQSYGEEKSFVHYEKRRSGKGVERFGATAMEHRMGENSHRSGSYLIQQEKAGIMKKEEGELEWEDEGDANNSTLPVSDVETSYSTSTYTSRCAVL